MLIRLSGGRVIDPANGRDGIGDLWIRDDRIIDPPNETPDVVHDVTGKIIMAGAIDIHSHIAGGNVNTARLLLPEHHRAHARAARDDAAVDRRLVDLRDRLPLRGDGLYNGRRAGRDAASCAARASRTGRYSDHRQGRLCRCSATTIFSCSLDPRRREAPRQSPITSPATLNATKGARHQSASTPAASAAFKHNVRGVRARRRRAGLWGELAARSSKRCSRRSPISACRIRCICHCNNLGMPGNVETALATIGRAEACRCISHICSSTPTARRASGLLLRRGRTRRGGQCASECDRRRRPGRCSARR